LASNRPVGDAGDLHI